MVWLNTGEILAVNAKKYRGKVAVKDANRQLSYEELEARTNRLANALLNLGMKRGDKLSIVLYNCVEFVEIYCAAAKIGVVANPINWRLAPKDIEYIVNHAESTVGFFGEHFVELANSLKSSIPKLQHYIAISNRDHEGFLNYEKLIASAPDKKPDVKVDPKEIWILLYTSGTTGVPKGVLRSHESYTAFYLINAVDFGFSDKDKMLVVMPLCHVNSTFYGFTFLYIGGSIYIHREREFNPAEVLEIIDREKITFTSLIPTHYALILNLPDDVKQKHDLSSVRKLLCSSAPVRAETKKSIMKMFPHAELYEAYGSTEAGLVTLLKPEDQYRKLASIGQECAGTDVLKLLGENGNEVPVGEVGELYSRGPMMFTEYYKNPEKTQKSFRGEYFSAGDMARKDEDGYYYIVDRKDNMIITGGEHVYPSEVEAVICTYPKVRDCAVIGIPHEKWGEAVMAVVIPKDGESPTENEIIQHCVGKLAGFKKPKYVKFITWDEMPRTGTGKILHRVLRERYAKKD